MERRSFGNADLTVSTIGLGCYGMSGAYGPADDAESIATIRRALDLGVNLLDTSASYGQGHNHRLIGEAIRGRRHEVVIHSKSGSPRDGSPEGARGAASANSSSFRLHRAVSTDGTVEMTESVPLRYCAPDG